MKSTIFLCFLAFTFFATEATNFKSSPNSKLVSPKEQAEKLIRSLNLSPTNDANIVEYEPSFDSPKIVETRFRFPHIADSSNSSGTSAEDFGHHAGYYRLPHTKGDSMFYFFFESRNKKVDAPVVIWLSGGPGCSSALALFYENGPFKLTHHLTLEWNEFGWDNETNLIYVDQPVGTGFSYSNNNSDLRTTSDEAAVDFYDFLQAFFEKHPQYAKNDFYITGESYAGHYIPAYSALIHQKNKKNEGRHINLKGIAIGNGLTDPLIQYKADPDYALDNKLINKTEFDNLTPEVKKCEESIGACARSNTSDLCEGAPAQCNFVVSSIVDFMFNLNYYDIRKKCTGESSLCYDFSGAEEFLNTASVKRALGVADKINFVSCNTEVFEKMIDDLVKNYALDIPDLLQDGIKVLIYAGEYDLICNWLGNSRWVKNLKWSGQAGFGSTRQVSFKVDGVEAGLQKSYGGLTFLKVYNAGHLVPMDQPKISLEMLNGWIRSKPGPT